MSNYELIVEHEDDRKVFSSAYLAHSPIQAIKNFRNEDYIAGEDAYKVIKGLAVVSLMSPGSDYHGLMQAEAAYRFGDIVGDPGDFFYPLLAAAEGR